MVFPCGTKSVSNVKVKIQIAVSLIPDFLGRKLVKAQS